MAARPHVIFEDQFGRDHAELADLIDVQFHVNVPLDVALARVILRSFDINQNFPVQRMLRSHLDVERHTRERMRQAQASADLVLDGQEPVDRLVHEALALLSRRGSDSSVSRA